MCCKLLAIPELDKPGMQWCSHCEVGVGCRIYADRPQSCRTFQCGFLTSPNLDERWRPSASKLIVSFHEAANRIYIHTEQSSAWRKEPFYSRIKAWANQMLRQHGQVLVWQANEIVAVLPHKDVNLGVVADNQRIHTKETLTPSGVEYDVVLVTKPDRS
jgi:hypothetical protein